MLVVDLNRDGKPELMVGYVGSPGAVYFNDGKGRKYQRVPFGDSRARFTAWRRPISMATVIRILWRHGPARRACCCSADRSADPANDAE
jgi:hypothetical protein